MERRRFIKNVAAAGAFAALAPREVLRAQAPPVRFGVDMYSVNRQGWTPIQMLDWASWNQTARRPSAIEIPVPAHGLG